MKVSTTLVAMAALLPLAAAENNGLALTPPMGWNPWNCWASSGASEEIVLEAARVMASKLKPVGYQYINLGTSVGLFLALLCFNSNSSLQHSFFIC